MWLLGMVLRIYIYIYFLILLIPTPLVSVLFCSSIPTFLFIFLNVFRSCIYIYITGNTTTCIYNVILPHVITGNTTTCIYHRVGRLYK